jgi:hypothetical protein
VTHLEGRLIYWRIQCYPGSYPTCGRAHGATLGVNRILRIPGLCAPWRVYPSKQRRSMLICGAILAYLYPLSARTRRPPTCDRHSSLPSQDMPCATCWRKRITRFHRLPLPYCSAMLGPARTLYPATPLSSLPPFPVPSLQARQATGWHHLGRFLAWLHTWWVYIQQQAAGSNLVSYPSVFSFFGLLGRQ